jgi:S1-C subfamily serine protease
MTVLDVLILVAVATAVWRGLALGAVVPLLTYGGVGAGLVAGAAAAPRAAGLVTDPTANVVVTLVCLIAGPLLLGGLGRYVGFRLSSGLQRARLGRLDAAAGAVVAGGATLLAAWLVGSLLATVPSPPVAAAAQRSFVMRKLDRLMPPAPAVFARIDRLIAAGGLPQVFAGLEPPPASAQPLPAETTVRAAADRAAGSVVKIVGPACGMLQEGSGFVAAPSLVVTNAHVVAGVSSPVVIDRAGRHKATTLVFDPNTDVAVLRTSGLAGRPLPLQPATVGPGADGAVIGFPGGGPLDVEPAVVLARFQAVGRDIYSRRLVARQVYQLRSRVRPGNSGGPFVDLEGRVVGVVFSRSVFRESIGFALTTPDVATHLRQAELVSQPVRTGPCAAG